MESIKCGEPSNVVPHPRLLSTGRDFAQLVCDVGQHTCGFACWAIHVCCGTSYPPKAPPQNHSFKFSFSKAWTVFMQAWPALNTPLPVSFNLYQASSADTGWTESINEIDSAAASQIAWLALPDKLSWASLTISLRDICRHRLRCWNTSHTSSTLGPDMLRLSWYVARLPIVGNSWHVPWLAALQPQGG